MRNYQINLAEEVRDGMPVGLLLDRYGSTINGMLCARRNRERVKRRFAYAA